MPNPLEYLRMLNIFNPQSMEMNNQPQMNDPMAGMNANPMPNIPNIPVQTGLPTPQTDVASRMRELYTPETAASDRFNKMVESYPEYEKPGWWRAAAGALSAFGPGGHDIGMRVANQNNIRRMEDWKNQIGPAQQAANIERQSNINERQLAHQTVSQEIAGRRVDETERNNRANQKIREDRARTYDYKARNPGFKFNFSGPKVIMTNPLTGEVVRTGIDTGSLSEEDKLDLMQENALGRIKATGEEARKTEGVRQEGRESIQDQRAWVIGSIPDPNDPTKQISVKMNAITGEVQPVTMGGQNVGPIAKPSSTGAKPELPTQTRVRQFNAARELFNTRPDLRRFIKLNPDNNTFEIMEPKPEQTFAGYTVSKGGPSPEQKAEIEAAIYGKAAPQPQVSTPGGGRGGGSGRGTQTPRFTPDKPPPAPAGWKYVPKPGGGWTAVPAGQ